VTWKVAATLDGRIADARGHSRWITGARARADSHRLRAESDALVVGAGTARADDPRLTARGVRGARQPLRVVVDSRLRLPAGLRLFSRALAAGTVVACTRSAPLARERALTARGVRVWRLPAARGRVSTAALARRLAAAGCHDVLLEGGATLGASFLAARLVQRLVLYSAPLVLGGGRAWCDGPARTLADAVRGRVASATRVGGDTRIIVDLEG
jgi:diaminohydroxyphosphoribosylaminopyrimidine deaminase/5-amino-6-(5-phosphoribosylamino)uracil reductase